MKKKVLVSAYAIENLGDDLFIKILCDRYKNTDFFLIASKKYRNIFKDYNNLYVINCENIIYRIINKFLKLIHKEKYILNYLISKSNALLYLGGSLFIENTNWQSRLDFKISKKKPIFLLGANFGPYNDNNFYLSFKNLFSNYYDVCFRDKYSYDLFKDLKQVRLASDIIFTLKTNEGCDIKEKNGVFISVMNLENRKKLKNYTEDYENKILEVASQLAQRSIPVSLVSFCKKEEDDVAIERIYRRMEKQYLKYIEILSYDGNLDYIIDRLSKSRLIIATRFHAMILGWVVKSNVIPLIYSNKTSNLINDVNFTGNKYKIEEINDMTIEIILENYEEKVPFNIENQIILATQHFEKLDEFLSNKDLY